MYLMFGEFKLTKVMCIGDLHDQRTQETSKEKLCAHCHLVDNGRHALML